MKITLTGASTVRGWLVEGSGEGHVHTVLRGGMKYIGDMRN